LRAHRVRRSNRRKGPWGEEREELPEIANSVPAPDRKSPERFGKVKSCGMNQELGEGPAFSSTELVHEGVGNWGGNQFSGGGRGQMDREKKGAGESCETDSKKEGGDLHRERRGNEFREGSAMEERENENIEGTTCVH